MIVKQTLTTVIATSEIRPKKKKWREEKSSVKYGKHEGEKWKRKSKTRLHTWMENEKSESSVSGGRTNIYYSALEEAFFGTYRIVPRQCMMCTIVRRVHSAHPVCRSLAMMHRIDKQAMCRFSWNTTHYERICGVMDVCMSRKQNQGTEWKDWSLLV